MASDLLLLLALVLALAIGWWLGRRETKRSSQGSTFSDPKLNRAYFQGLNHLLNERTDEAIESFIQALEINSDTLPAHLSLARLLRSKGEVERAIGVHQTLLARPGLAHQDFLQIQLALARDYDAIGLLDRAENLLLEIIRDNPGRELRQDAQSLLVKLYEKEGEWQKALEQARRLIAEGDQALRVAAAHYCCEIADGLLPRQRLREAAACARDALALDPAAVRASLLIARVAMEQERWPAAIQALKRVREQEPIFISESVELLRRCYQRLGDLQQYENYLDQCMVRSPSTTVMLARAERVQERNGVVAAGRYLSDELKSRPSIRGLNRLIDLYLEYGSPSARESLTVLRGLTGQLEQSKARYQCVQCGYVARTLHWQCPSCRRWNVIRPVQGLEGE